VEKSLLLSEFIDVYHRVKCLTVFLEFAVIFLQTVKRMYQENKASKIWPIMKWSSIIRQENTQLQNRLMV